MAGPEMRARFMAIDWSTTALGRSRAGTALATSAWLAGCATECTTPTAKPHTMSATTGARSSSTRVVVTALTARMPYCAASTMRRRSWVSASTPAGRLMSSIGSRIEK
jgi:hypothetical protein